MKTLYCNCRLRIIIFLSEYVKGDYLCLRASFAIFFGFIKKFPFWPFSRRGGGGWRWSIQVRKYQQLITLILLTFSQSFYLSFPFSTYIQYRIINLYKDMIYNLVINFTKTWYMTINTILCTWQVQFKYSAGYNSLEHSNR